MKKVISMWNNKRKANKTINDNRKFTKFDNIIEIIRTSLGKYIFFIRFALSIMVLVESANTMEKKCQGRIPASKNMGKCSI